MNADDLDPRTLEERILAALQPKSARVQSVSDLVRALAGKNPTDEREAAVRAAIASLERKGDLVRVKGEKVSRIEFTDYAAGRLADRRGGSAGVVPGEPGGAEPP